MCFLCVFMCKNVFGREEKCAKNVQAKGKTQKSLSFLGLEVPKAFYSLGTDYESVALQGPPPSNDPRWD